MNGRDKHGDGKTLLREGPIRLKRCRWGPMLYLVTDTYAGQSLHRYGEYSQGEVDLLCSYIDAGDTVLDVGANMGALTVPLAQEVGSDGCVLAFEPQPVIFAILCANAALNGLSHVRARNAAVGAAPGSITVPLFDFTAPDNFGGLALGDWPEGEEVPVLAIDDLGLARCDLIKIDVEGMESDVLAGAEATIRRLHPVLYVENDREERSAALIEQLFDLDYRLYWHLPPLYTSCNFFAEPDNVFGDLISANMLGLHPAAGRRPPALPEITSPHTTWRNVGLSS